MIGGPCQRPSSGYAALQNHDAVREDDEHGYHRRYSGVSHVIFDLSFPDAKLIYTDQEG